MSPVTPRPALFRRATWRAGGCSTRRPGRPSHRTSPSAPMTRRCSSRRQPGTPNLVGASVHFDGVAQHAVAPHHPDFNFLGLKFSIDFWIRPNAGELFVTSVRKGAPSPSVPALAGLGGTTSGTTRDTSSCRERTRSRWGSRDSTPPLSGCPPDAYFFAGRLDELEIFDWKLTAAVG